MQHYVSPDTFRLPVYSSEAHKYAQHARISLVRFSWSFQADKLSEESFRRLTRQAVKVGQLKANIENSLTTEGRVRGERRERIRKVASRREALAVCYGGGAFDLFNLCPVVEG